MRTLPIVVGLTIVVLAVLAAGCKTTISVAFVNPNAQPLFVQIDQREPFEVPANGTAHSSVPALERLQPITITARDARGATVFFVTTSLPRIEATGHRIDLKASGEKVDPLLQPYKGFPNVD